MTNIQHFIKIFIERGLDKLKIIKPEWLFLVMYLTIAVKGALLVNIEAIHFIKLINKLNELILIFCGISLFFNLFVYKLYTYKKFMSHLLISLFIFWVCKNIHNYTLFNTWFFIIAIGCVSFRKISKIVLTTTVSFLVLTVMLAAIGYIPNLAIIRFEPPYIMRYCFGFGDPNLFSAYLLQICMALIYVRWKAFSSIDNIFLFSVLFIVYFFANSRTTTVVLLILIILVNYCRIKSCMLNKVKHLANVSLIFCPVFSLIISKLYCIGFPLALQIDELFSCRFRNVCFCMSSYPLSILGNRIMIRFDMQMLVNLYGVLLIKYGIVIFLLFMTGFTLLIRKVYQEKDIPLLIILILSLFQGISEQYLLLIYLNFGILAFSYLLNNKR